MDDGGYTPLDVASTHSIWELLNAAGSHGGPRATIFNDSVLAGEGVAVYGAFLAGSDSANDPKYNMREWSGHHPCDISSIHNGPHVVEVLSSYVALRLSSRAHLPLLESHLRLNPFEDYDGPRSDDWSIYRLEQQVASEVCYVILQGKWILAKPGKSRVKRIFAACDEAIEEQIILFKESTYIGPVGKQLEKWFDGFKQRATYINEKWQKWKEHLGREMRNSRNKSPLCRPWTPNTKLEFEGHWGLGPYYERRSPMIKKTQYIPFTHVEILDMSPYDAKRGQSLICNSEEEEPVEGLSERSDSSERCWEEPSETSSEWSSEDSSELFTGGYIGRSFGF